MKKDKEWLKREIYVEYNDSNFIKVAWDLIDQLDEPETLSQEWIDENKVARIDNLRKMTTSDVVPVEKLKNLLVPKQDKPEQTDTNVGLSKVVIPQYVADWIEESKNNYTLFGLFQNARGEVSSWIFNANYKEERANMIARAWLDGYEVEKELLWEIPMPDLKTTGGHIQYLTYDPKARTYFASRKNGRLKQTFNAKDLASVPGQYRRYAELCDFKKIQGVTE